MISMPGSGTPISPGLMAAPGLRWVPEEQVSVMPQPPPTRRPVSPSNRRATSTGSVAPPQLALRREARLRRSRSGCAARAMNMVGTPGRLVAPRCSMSSSTCAASKRSRSRMATPSARQRSITATSA